MARRRFILARSKNEQATNAATQSIDALVRLIFVFSDEPGRDLSLLSRLS